MSVKEESPILPPLGTQKHEGFYIPMAASKLEKEDFKFHTNTEGDSMEIQIGQETQWNYKTGKEDFCMMKTSWIIQSLALRVLVRIPLSCNLRSQSRVKNKRSIEAKRPPQKRSAKINQAWESTFPITLII